MGLAWKGKPFYNQVSLCQEAYLPKWTREIIYALALLLPVYAVLYGVAWWLVQHHWPERQAYATVEVSAYTLAMLAQIVSAFVLPRFREPRPWKWAVELFWGFSLTVLFVLYRINTYANLNRPYHLFGITALMAFACLTLLYAWLIGGIFFALLRIPYNRYVSSNVSDNFLGSG